MVLSKTIAVMIYNRLKNRNQSCITWINFFLRRFHDPTIVENLKYVINPNKIKGVERRLGRSKVDVIIWEILMQFIPQEYTDPLFLSYFTLTENRPVLMTCVSHILLDKNKNVPLAQRKAQFDQMKDLWGSKEQRKMIESLTSFNYQIVIKDYMKDQHVLGKRRELRVLSKESNSQMKELMLITRTQMHMIPLWMKYINCKLEISGV